MSSEDIVNTHDTFMKSLGIELSEEDERLPYLYWTPELQKSSVKHRFIAGSSKCTTKQLFSLLTKISKITFMKSLGIELSEKGERLPYLYWTLKLHKSPVKHRFITGSSKCTTKQLSSPAY